MHTFHTPSDQDRAEAAGEAGGRNEKETFFLPQKTKADRRAPPARSVGLGEIDEHGNGCR